MRSRLLFVIFLVGLLDAVTVSVAAANQRLLPTAPEALVLRPGDLPAAFYLTAAHPVTAREFATTYHLSPATLDRHGSVSGYETSFWRHGSTGMLGVLCEVLQSRSAAGAHWAYNRVLDQDLHLRTKYGQYQEFPVGDIGDERTGLIFTYDRDNIAVMAHATVFRRGAHLVEVVAVSGQWGFLPGQAVQLAEIVDNRIQRSR